jgi:hypothetical protein
MCANDPLIDDEASTAVQVDRRTVLKNVATASAAAGVVASAAGSAGAHATENRLVLEALNGGVQFMFKVSGTVKRGDLATDFDVVQGGDVAVGEIPKEGERTSFRFSGKVTAFVTGADDAAVWRNGERVDSEEFSDAGLLPNFIHVEARGKEVEYHIDVSGDVDHGRLSDPAFTENINHGTVTGKVIPGDVDNFYFSGFIKHVEATGPLDVELLFEGARET